MAKYIAHSLILVLAAVLVSSCSSVKSRGPGSNFWDGLILKSTPTKQSINLKSGIVYSDFQASLEVDAIIKDDAYSASLKQFASETTNANLIDDQGFVELLLVVYSPTKRLSKSTLQDYWNINFSLSEQSLVLETILELDDSNLDYKFVNENSKVIDRWTTLYLLRYGWPPNYINEKPAALKIKGAKGETTIVWDSVLLTAP